MRNDKRSEGALASMPAGRWSLVQAGAEGLPLLRAQKFFSDAGAAHRHAEETRRRLFETTKDMIQCINEQKAANHEKKRKIEEEAMKKKTAYFIPELPWGLPPTLKAKTRGTIFLNIWEVVTACGCLYVSTMIPFKLGFEKIYTANMGDECIFSPSDTMSTFFYFSRALDVLFDVIFWIDIWVNFNTGRWVMRIDPDSKVVHWTLVDELEEVRRSYLKGMFFLDFVGSIPVQYIDCISNADTGPFKMVRLVRLFKLLRLARLHELVVFIKKVFPASFYFVIFVELFLYFFLFCHWTACMFFLLAYGYADPTGDEYAQYLFFEGWIYNDGSSAPFPPSNH